MADAPRLHVGRCDGVQALRRVGVQRQQVAGAAGGHQFVVGHGQGQHRETYTGITLLGRRTFGAHAVARVQAPAAPLQDDTGGQVADLAQAPAREVATQPGGQGHQHMPEVQHGALEARRVVAPVAAARRHTHQPIHLLGVPEEARQLRAQAVPQQVERRARQGLASMGDDSLVVLRPVRQIGPHTPGGVAAQRIERGAHTPVVEGADPKALPGQPLRETGIEILPYAHGRADDDAGLRGRRALCLEAAHHDGGGTRLARRCQYCLLHRCLLSMPICVGLKW